ncbi:beta-ketoacyl-ACP synthase II [Enorma burkinafasonensis]|uniref:beta-ketoacyl-ACP synthase II n=1 Tax=Enorma burkinafasonensis TaxID=2590867 RepID=UPI0026F090B2|nr:beta-ketoacyl-ACP synthase II [Enorma burkinafasonensis]MCI7730755.1 beta-ketoacyl-ACP synthase II [Enorma burkinafasonensis]
MEHRVVITGMGAVSPVGNTAPATWDALVAGTSGIAPIANVSTEGLKVTVAAEVKGFDGAERLGEDVRHKDLNVQYALAASDEAMADAGLSEAEGLDRTRIGVYVGSGIGGMKSYTDAVDTMRARGFRRCPPFMIPMMIGNMAAGEVSIRHKLTGPTLPVVTACATSAHTVGEAFRAIKHGYADAILAGGAEACIVPEAIAGFTNCKALTRNDDPATACRPFDANRDGFVMGEGACILVLEELEHAKARGAHIYCEVVGYGNTADAYHITSPAPDAQGITRAIKEAVAEGGVDTAESLYINAHGTSTPLNDKTETIGFKQALGEDAARSAHISSTKSMTGHMLGATGALEAMACARAIETGVIPPTIGLAEPDPECDLDYTPGHAASATVRWALSTNLGFGGHNAALAFKAYEG